jgi:hypothetical protein
MKRTFSDLKLIDDYDVVRFSRCLGKITADVGKEVSST